MKLFNNKGFAPLVVIGIGLLAGAAATVGYIVVNHAHALIK